MKFFPWLFSILITPTFSLFSVEPTVSSNDLPRFPPVPPAQALKTFKMKPGFHMEIVAAEPDVVSPVAVSFDEHGRMYVVEMIDYSERRDEIPHLGRIRLLEDTNGDGVFDKSSVFADNLPWPTAVICYDGGILVGATPDILYLKDTNGDAHADIRETLFSGFGEGVKRINVQAMLNSFTWGLDNRIHGATSGNGGVIKSLRHPEAKPVDLHGRDFLFVPRTMTMTSEAGGGQHGLSFDNSGRRFACNNSDHIRLYMYDDRYAGRNPFYSMPSPLESIAVDGPAAEVYRISPEEPWRVIRTRWRVAGLVGGPVEGGGRASGYFTGATGTTIYRGDAYPSEYLGNAFVGDAGGNLVHRKVLAANGVSLKAQRGPGEETMEFAASTDTWFRPVQFANTPDGTLYVIDMYREIIEHPWSLPDNIKRYLDLNSGNNRGRIYRIAPDGFKPRPAPRLDKATTSELVATLANPNGWHRDTSARLIYERQDPAAVSILKAFLGQSKVSLARLHALYCLQGLGALREEQLQEALNDSDPIVREHAVKLSENLLVNGSASASLRSKLQGLANDTNIRVRYQLAFTLGQLSGSGKIASLGTIARQDLESSWTQAAILSSLTQDAGELFKALSGDPKYLESNSGENFLRQMLIIVGARQEPGELAEVLNFISSVKNPSVTFGMVSGLGEGLRKNGVPLAKLGVKIQPIVAEATKIAAARGTSQAIRLRAIELLQLTSFDEAGELLLSLLTPQEAETIQLASLSALNHFANPNVGAGLLKLWPELSPRIQSSALTVLLGRAERATALLQAIGAGSIRPAALTTSQINFLQNHQNAEVRSSATKIFGGAGAGMRQKVLEGYLPSLNLKGDSTRGRKVYQERCISCHRVGSAGYALGPDLVTVKNTGKEKLLVNILDPNREVRPEFLSYVVETKDGESYIGILANETPTSITVRQAYGKQDVIKRSEVTKLQSQGQSLMPEGIEAGMSQQDMADLLEFIESADQR